MIISIYILRKLRIDLKEIIEAYKIEENLNNNQERITDLEIIIAEYEKPHVYFQEFKGDDVYMGDDTVNLADDGNLFCSYNEYYNENSCLLVGIT